MQGLRENEKMKTVIYYFSGTGNTEKVVRTACGALQAHGWQADACAIEKAENTAAAVASCGCIGIAYPVHAFNAPASVLRFCEELPAQKEPMPFYVFKTSGEPLALNNISSLKLRAVLEKKNYVFRGEYHYVMPYNIIFRHSDAMAYRMWETAKRLIPLDCADLAAGRVPPEKKFPFGGALAWVMRVEHWGGRWNGKKYSVEESCVHCMKCVNECPTRNIRYEDDAFRFGGDCLMCMRCAFRCPKNAIRIGLFNKWKVNGAYSFLPPAEEEEERHKRYCKAAYRRYFSAARERVLACGGDFPDELLMPSAEEETVSARAAE